MPQLLVAWLIQVSTHEQLPVYGQLPCWLWPLLSSWCQH